MKGAPALMKLILASSSPARQKLLTDSGVDFQVLVSDVDEDAVLAQAQEKAFAAGLGEITPAQTAQLLAQAKAQDVAARVEAADALVLGCDSVFEFDGGAYGKPHTVERARQRITAMSGQSGQLHTGHWLIDTATGKEASELRTAIVHFDRLSDEEIEAYLATEEPLWVAGSFTIDGFGAPFIKGIEGEFHTVVGLSLNALRSMMHQLGQSITNFWRKPH